MHLILCMMSNLMLLPVDILINIFKKIKIPDLRNLMLTCKALRNLIVNDNTIWRSVCRDRLILNNPQHSSQSRNLSLFNRCRISRNWCNGYYRSKVVIHHYTNYMPWLILHNSEALVLSVGSELCCYPTHKNGLPNGINILWRLDVPKIKRNGVRTNDISRFVIKDKLLACGNRDGCVAVYKLDNIYTEPRLISHIKDCHDNGQNEVSAVELIHSNGQTTVLTGSYDSPNLFLCCMMEDEENGNEILTRNNYFKIAAHVPAYENAGIRSLSVNQGMDRLAIGLNGNSKPLLLDVNIGQLLIVGGATADAKQEVRDIGWHDENTITYVTHSGVLQLVDIRSHEVVYNIKDPFQSTLYCVRSDGEHAIVVGSAEYSRCVLFDTRNRVHHVQMYFTQRKTSPVYSLHFDATKLITAVDRGVAVLNFNIDPRTVQQKDYSDVFF